MLDEIVTIFADYVIYDENDEWCGVQEDSPEYVKEAYRKYEKIMEEAERNGRVV